MKYRKLTIVLRRLLLAAVIIEILIHVNAVFERKTVGGPWNYSIKIGCLQNEPVNSFDIMGFGSSHMYCTLNPVYLYEQTGLRSYVFATQQQPPIATYYYVKEALKTQKPDVLVVEALMFALCDEQVSEGVAHDAIDFFPDSWDKFHMIHRMNQEDKKENYYINFLKYHSRWKELTKQDFSFDYLKSTDPFHGYVFLTNTTPNDLTLTCYDDVESGVLSEGNMQILLDIKELAEANNIQMLLLISPSWERTEVKSNFKALHTFAEQNGIHVLDLNMVLDEVGLDNNMDYFDAGHLNVTGAEKASLYIGDYIQNHYEITDKNVDDDALWQEDIKVYYEAKNAQ